KVRRQIDDLRELVAANPPQQARLVALESLVDRELAELKKVVDLGQSKGLAAGINEIKTGEGKRLLDEIRRGLKEMQNVEKDSLRNRHEVVTAAGRSTLGTILGGTLV